MNVYLLRNMILSHKTYKYVGHPWGLCMIQLDIFDTRTFLELRSYYSHNYPSILGKLKLKHCPGIDSRNSTTTLLDMGRKRSNRSGNLLKSNQIKFCSSGIKTRNKNHEPLTGLPEVMGVVNGLRALVEILVQNM